MCSSGMETSVSGYRIIISLQSPSTSTALQHTYSLLPASGLMLPSLISAVCLDAYVDNTLLV